MSPVASCLLLGVHVEMNADDDDVNILIYIHKKTYNNTGIALVFKQQA